jgi:hypothetical protein
VLSLLTPSPSSSVGPGAPLISEKPSDLTPNIPIHQSRRALCALPWISPLPMNPTPKCFPFPFLCRSTPPHPLLFMQDPFQSFPDRLISGCVPEHPPPSVSSTSTPPPLSDKPSTKPPCPISTPCASEAHHEHLVIAWPPKSHRWSCHVAAAHALLHADVRPRSTLVVLGQPVGLWARGG